MKITRRSFLKTIAAVSAILGLSELELLKLKEAVSKASGVKVVWITAQACSGCEISFLGLRQASGRIFDVLHTTAVPGSSHTLDGLIESSTTTIDDVLIDLIDLNFLSLTMNPAAYQALAVLKEFYPVSMGGGGYIGHLLMVSGSIPVDGSNVVGKVSCGIAEDESGNKIYSYDVIRAVAQNASVVFSVGTCASYGGVPAARNLAYEATTAKYKSTGAASTSTVLTGISTPVLNIPGCPVNPNALYLCLANYLFDLLNGVTTLLKPANIDFMQRPKEALGIKLFSETLHGANCPRYPYYTSGFFASKPGEAGCLALLGCRGIFTYAPCSKASSQNTVEPYWNDHFSFCMQVGVPCQGCTEKGFPDRVSPIIFY